MIGDRRREQSSQNLRSVAVRSRQYNCEMDITQSLPTVDSVLQLEPEELGGYLLETLANPRPGSPSDLHPSSLTARIGSYYRDERATDAILEAWAWLVSERLLIAKQNGWHFISRRGHKLKGRQDLLAYRKSNILPKESLHPTIADRVWSSFIRGDYDVAVFQAFKEVEVAVRAGGGYTVADYGVDLMSKAFKVDSGDLADMQLPEPERKAMLLLFLGATGLFKNPSSHRHMTLTDPHEAAEMISFASLLMRIVDSRIDALKANTK